MSNASPTGFGPLAMLEGVWANEDELRNHGWNSIALPFARNSRDNYRILVNQYSETLEITTAGACNPNRGMPGINIVPGDCENTGCVGDPGDQQIAALQYIQNIRQAAGADFPVSEDAPGPNLVAGRGDTIHHEPGLFLYMKNHSTADMEVARMGTVPHGDSLLAMGFHGKLDNPIAEPVEQQNIIPDFELLPTGNALPSGFTLPQLNLLDGYLEPYNHFHQSPFSGDTGGQDEFDPVFPLELLKKANVDPDIEILEVYKFDFNTELSSGGIKNIPFIVKQADAASMRAAFRVMKVRHVASGEEETRLQYAQVVDLDFFEHPQGPHKGSIIRWPHVSINTLKKVG